LKKNIAAALAIVFINADTNWNIPNPPHRSKAYSTETFSISNSLSFEKCLFYVLERIDSDLFSVKSSLL
jgi:hypothetical protein